MNSHAPAMAAISRRTRRGGFPIEAGRPFRDVVQCIQPWRVISWKGGRAADAVGVRQGFSEFPTSGQA